MGGQVCVCACCVVIDQTTSNLMPGPVEPPANALPDRQRVFLQGALEVSSVDVHSGRRGKVESGEEDEIADESER